jgi:hypothetical protein
MKLFIPHLKTLLKLERDWFFELNPEYRNMSLYQVFSGQIIDRWAANAPFRKMLPVTIPKDTILSLDRIYIRNGNRQYDSVTFRIPKKMGNPPELAGCRFWVKLDQANEIEASIIEKP